MLYYGNNPILRITDVAQLRRDYGSFAVGIREYAELTFVTAGKVTIECYGEKYTVNSGDILYLPQKMSFAVSYFGAEMITACFETLTPDLYPEIYSLHGARFLNTLFSSLLGIWNLNDSSRQIQCISLLYRILCTAFHRSQVPPQLTKAITYIHANYRKSELTVGQICDYVGTSQTTLRQLFSTHYHKSPIEYIIQLRLLNARVLIADGMSIEAAALESGFNDSKYFARISKKYLEHSPSELKDFD